MLKCSWKSIDIIGKGPGKLAFHGSALVLNPLPKSKESIYKFESDSSSIMHPGIYIFGGLGIVFGESKTTQFSKDIVGGHSLKKRTTQTLGLELGLGTKVMLSQKINLEVNAKYFDYGKYALSKDISKKIDGYKQIPF